MLNTSMLMTHPSKVHEVRLVVEKKEGVRERGREEGQRCGTHRGKEGGKEGRREDVGG